MCNGNKFLELATSLLKSNLEMINKQVDRRNWLEKLTQQSGRVTTSECDEVEKLKQEIDIRNRINRLGNAYLRHGAGSNLTEMLVDWIEGEERKIDLL